MSSIDERIVQMQFNNSQFEKGVAESTKSLEKFKKELDFKDGTRSLESLQKAGDSFSLARMADGIEHIGEKFTTLGLIGRRVLENLTDSAYQAGMAFIKSVSTDQINAGFAKYEDKTRSVQTIVAATGLTVGQVNDELSRLNWFTDETSYNFTDMVSNIGKFTSMNIPLKDSVTAMEGIATWAAVSGQGANEASRAMYNLSQAMGVGAVKLMDWKSIENANMATAEFKQTAIDTAMAMGTLNKTSKTAKGTAVSLTNFSQTLQEGWFTSDVLMATLKKYGQYADEVYKVATEEGITAAEAMKKVSGETMKLGEKAFKAAQEAKTFTEAIDSVKDAVSTGWMNTFEIIFGDYQEAKELWTNLANDLWDIFAAGAEARNALLQGWKDEGGRDDFISGLSDAMQGLKSIIEGVKEAFYSIFPETTVQDLKAISSKVKELGENFKNAFSPVEEIVGWTKEIKESTQGGMEDLNEELKRGSRGEGVKLLQERLVKLGYDIGAAGVDGILGPDTERALNQFKKETGLAVDGLYDSVTHEALGKKLGLDEKTVKTLVDVPIIIEKIPPKLQWLKNILSGVFAVASIGKKILTFFWNVLRSIGDTLSPITSMMAKIADAASRFFVALNERLGKSTVFSRWLESIDKFLGPVKKKIEELCNSFLNLLGIGGDLDKIDFSKVVDNLFTSIKKLFGIGLDSESITSGLDVKSIIETIKGKISDIYNGVKNWIVSVFSKNGTGEVSGGFKLDGYTIGIGAIGVIVATISGKLIQFASVVVKAGKEVTKTLKNVRKITGELKNRLMFGNAKSGFEVISEGVMKLAIGIGIMAASLYFLSQLSWDKIAVGLTGLGAILVMLVGTIFALKYASKGFDNMNEVAEVVSKIGSAIGALAITTTMLGNLSWSELARGLVGTIVLLGACIGALVILSKIKVNIKEVSGLIGLIGSLALVLGNLAGVVKKLGSLDITTLIKGFAGLGLLLIGLGAFMKAIGKIRVSPANALALIASAVAIDGLILGFLLLSFSMKLLKPADIVKGTIGLTVIVLGLAGLLKLIEKIHPSVGAVMSLLPAAIAIDLLIGGFIAMVFVMKFVKAADVLKAFAGMATIVLGLAGLLKLIEKIHPSIGSVLALLPAAIAIDLLILGFVGLLYTMRKATPGDIVKAFAGLVIIVATMSKTIKAISKNKPSIRGILALLPVALALDLAIIGFVGLAFMMKSIDAKTMAKTIIAFGAILVGFSVMTKALSKAAEGLKSIKGILALIPIVLVMAGLMASFVFFAKSMEGMSYSTIIKAILGLAAVVISMKSLAKISSQSMNLGKALSMLISVIAVAGLMLVFAHVLKKIRGIKPSAILAFSTGLSEIMLAMSVVGRIAGSDPLGSFLGIIAVAGALGVVMGAVMGLLSIPEVEQFLNGGAEKLGKLVGSFIGAMKASELESFAKAASSMGEINTIDQGKVDNAIAAAQAVADFGAGLPKKGLAEKAIDFIFGSELKQFSNDMVAFGTGFNSFATEIGMITQTTEELETKTKSAISIANSIKDFGNSLSKKSITKTIVDGIFGSELSQFSGDMAAFGAGFNFFATEIGKVNDPGEELKNKTDYAIKIAESIKKFGETLPEKTVAETIVEGLFGSELSQFSGDMVGFATGFNSFATQMKKIDDPGKELEDKTKYAISIAKSINDFGKSLVDKSVSDTIIDGIFGSELSQFSSDMGSFGTGMNAFAVQMQSFEDPGKELEEKTGYAVRIAEAINSFAGKLAQRSVSESIVEGVFGSELARFSTDMPGFATGFKTFAQQMQSFEDPGTELETKTGYAVRIAESVNEFAGKLSEKSFSQALAATLFGSSLNQFMADLPGFAEHIKDYGDKIKLFEDPGDELEDKTGYAVRIASSISKFSSTFTDKSFGQSLTDTVFGSAFAQFNTDMTDFASKFNTYAETITSVTHDPSETEKATTNAIGIATQIADFMATLKDKNIEKKAGAIKGLFTDKTAFDTVLSGIGSMGDKLNKSASSFVEIQSKGLTKEVMGNAIDALKNVANFMSFLSGKDLDTTYSDMLSGGYEIDKDKSEELLGFVDKIANRLVTFSNTVGDVDISSIASVLSAISQILLMLSDESFVLTSDAIDKLDLSVLTRFLDTVPPEISTHSGDFEVAGQNLVVGLVNGIVNSESFAFDTMVALANALVARFKEAAGIASPSKVMTIIGEFFVEGLTKGISATGKESVTATQTVAENMIDVAQGTLMSLSQLLAQDIDVDPVITPVVDLTNARESAATISSLFGTQESGLNVTRNLANKMNYDGTGEIVMRPEQISAENLSILKTDLDTISAGLANMSNSDVVDGLNTMSDNFADLAEAVRNMKLVLDTGALVGNTSAAYDREFGLMTGRRERGN